MDFFSFALHTLQYSHPCSNQSFLFFSLLATLYETLLFSCSSGLRAFGSFGKKKKKDAVPK